MEDDIKMIKYCCFIMFALFAVMFFYLLAVIKTVNSNCDTIASVQDQQDKIINIITTAPYPDPELADG